MNNKSVESRLTDKGNFNDDWMYLVIRSLFKLDKTAVDLTMSVYSSLNFKMTPP